LVYAAAGSVAAVSASVVGNLSGGDQDTAVLMTSALALTTGVVFVVAGLVRLGWIVNFISKAVMAGFITGMSIQIIIGQFDKLFGVDTGDGNSLQQLWAAITSVADWDNTTTVIGLLSIAGIFAIQKYVPRLPAALTIVVLTSVFVAVADPDIDLVAEIPTGLPSFGVPSGISGSDWWTLLLGGAVVALVGFSEGWGASAQVSKKTHTTT
jgi:SulP family sulfate permease